ncbi:hypothetical protein [Lacrimispora brassicae]
MGKVIIAGSGGSEAGSDECTASKAEVLKGYKAITSDSTDEVAEGTLELTGDASDSQVLEGKTYYNSNPKIKRTGSMVNHGAVALSLNAGASYTVPAGFHNGGGKVTTNSLASQTSATATAAQILSGQTAWVNGGKITGNIASLAGQTITPGASQQTVSSSGKYMTGNVVVAGDGDLVAGNILRGKNIFNVAGSNNVLKYINGQGTSGTSSLSLGNGTYWYYLTVNPGFNPVFAVVICGSILWRVNGTSANYESTNNGASGYYGSISTSTWTWTSSSVMLPCSSRSETCYYYIFGY